MIEIVPSSLRRNLAAKAGEPLAEPDRLFASRAVAAWFECYRRRRGVGYACETESLADRRGIADMPADICIHPWDYWVDPFRIAGDLYYVGNKDVSSHLIDTGAGLVLLDTAFPQTVYLLLV